MPIGVFVFTDIEGSTQLWTRCPEDMERALAQHDQVIGAALTSAGGTVFKHTGDGVCAAFSSARDAMVGAVSAQQRLTAADWGEIAPLRVRMAVHAGEAKRRKDDWFGPALNRTARLLGVAHGGQVLASGAAVELAVDALPAGVGVKDLGVHRLRDLAQPEHVWQLVGEGLDVEFPALRSLDRFRGNLPTLLTSFLGREVEVQELAAALVDHRLVTLVGPGGVGKTRLALQTAAGVVHNFRDGAWFIELARLADPSALDHAVSTTLGLTPRRGLTERQIILDAVHEWAALFIVDNCEHMSAATAGFVEQLLSTTGSVVVLATSREPLHLASEKVWPAAPLAVEEGAAQLFVERAAAVRHDFVIVQDDDDVAAICRRLDGIPLALELAAARMRSMTTAELLARLDQRFRLLGTPAGREDHARHHSLQATMDWSFELLSEPARALFARLSVFPGAFNLDAAHAVCGLASDDELTTLDLLDTLVDKSLVTAAERHGETHYSLLETMRQYGRDRLTPDEVERTRLRHAEHFADFAEAAWQGVRSSDDVAWVMRVDENLDNIRVAVEYALAHEDADLALRLIANLEPYNQPRRNSEIWAWAEAAITLPAAETHPLVVRGCQLLAFGAHARDNPPEATRWARRARELHDALELPPDPRLGIMLAYGTGYQGLSDQCADAIGEALRTAAAIGPAADIDRAEANYQSIFASLGSGSPDVGRAEELVSLAERLGNVYMLTRAKTALGLAIAPIDPSRGAALFDEAVGHTRTAHPPYWTGSTVVLAAAIRPDPHDAIECLAAGMDEFRASGTQQWIRRTLREFLGPFAAAGRHQTVALIDGIAPPFTIRPEQAEAAIVAARQHLGDEQYEQVRDRGAQVSDSELADLIRREISVLFEEPPEASGRVAGP